MKKAYAFIVLFWCIKLSYTAIAQQDVVLPDRAYLYQIDDMAIVDKIEREHIPLDGALVDYIPYREADLYGFVHKGTHAWAISPRFQQVFAVYPEGAIVKYQNRDSAMNGYGLVDYKGKWLIYPAFENFFKEVNLYHGVFIAIDTGMPEPYNMHIANYYFDTAGKFVFHAAAHDFQSFQAGDTLAWFRKGPQYSVYSQRGLLLKTFVYQEGKSFLGIYNNLLLWRTEERDKQVHYQAYDIRGKMQFDLPYSGTSLTAVMKMNDTLYALLSDIGLGFCNASGKDYSFGIDNDWVGNGFEHLYAFFRNMELIPVKDFSTQKMGALDWKGKLEIPFRYYNLYCFTDGNAFYESENHFFGVVNKHNKELVPPVLNRAVDKGGIGSIIADKDVVSRDKWYRSQEFILKEDADGNKVVFADEEGNLPYRIVFVDKQGNVQLRLSDSICYAGNFSDDLLAVVTKGGDVGFVDRAGKLKIPFKYHLALAGAYPMPYAILPEFIHGYAYIRNSKAYIDTSGKEYFSGKFTPDHYNFSH